MGDLRSADGSAFAPLVGAAPEAKVLQPVTGHTYRRKVSARKFGLVCMHLARCGVLAVACDRAGVLPGSVLADAAADPRRAEKLDAARDAATGKVERSVFVRATVGAKKPVTYRGEITAEYREPSDELALAWLRAHRPEVWAKGPESRSLHLHAHVAAELSDEQLAAIVAKNSKDSK